MRDLVFYVLTSSKIQLESLLKAKGFAFPLTAEWHWFCVCLSPLLQPLQGHSVFLELFMNVTSGFKKKNLPLSTSHIQYLCESLCYSKLELVYEFNPATWVDAWISFRKPPWHLCALIRDANFCCRDILWSCSLSRLPVDYIDCNISNVLFAIFHLSSVHK